MWSARKAAVVWGSIAMIVGVVIAVAMQPRRHYGDPAFDHGFQTGLKLGPAIIGIAVIAYFVQKRRPQR